MFQSTYYVDCFMTVFTEFLLLIIFPSFFLSQNAELVVAQLLANTSAAGRGMDERAAQANMKDRNSMGSTLGLRITNPDRLGPSGASAAASAATPWDGEVSIM